MYVLLLGRLAFLSSLSLGCVCLCCCADASCLSTIHLHLVLVSWLCRRPLYAVAQNRWLRVQPTPKAAAFSVSALGRVWHNFWMGQLNFKYSCIHHEANDKTQHSGTQFVWVDCVLSQVGCSVLSSTLEGGGMYRAAPKRPPLLGSPSCSRCTIRALHRVAFRVT
eukprot:3058157-Rhodomonas_salina.2